MFSCLNMKAQRKTNKQKGETSDTKLFFIKAISSKDENVNLGCRIVNTLYPYKTGILMALHLKGHTLSHGAVLE